MPDKSIRQLPDGRWLVTDASADGDAPNPDATLTDRIYDTEVEALDDYLQRLPLEEIQDHEP